MAYCQDRMEAGYRVLCWQMVDLDIAAASPGTVYNVLKRGGLTKKRAERAEEGKKGFDQPQGIHEQWHTDFSYIRVCGSFYYFSKDFRELVRLLEMEQTFASPAHPQSNGKLERFHRTFKSEHVRQSAYLGREDAVERMEKWIRYYNGQRLHAALFYLPPDDVFFGRMDIRLAERREKLHTAYINRQSYWQAQAAEL
jgi:hypothetical protein